MKTVNRQTKNKKGEKGAALVMVLLLTSLLLVVCFGILMEASLNTANVTDTIAEQQAYNAAESGIQTAINVLRANTVPSPLLDSSKPASHPNNKIDFAKAIKLSTSNSETDTSVEARLSRWMTYNYTPDGETIPDRVTIGGGTYNPLNGLAYTVSVRDPDNPAKIIKLTTSGKIGGTSNTKTFGFLTNTATITYNSVNTGDIDVSVREANVNLGSFTITTTGFGAMIPDTDFEITVRMTAPLQAVVVVRGKITGGTIKNNSVGNVKIKFAAPIFSLLGSAVTFPLTSITPNAPETNSGKTELGVTVTLSQPKRLVIRSVGYGPRGAKKVLEAIVQRDVFDGIIPATVMLVGKTVGSVFNSGSGLLQNVSYSGNDILSSAKIPPIGATDKTGNGNLLNVVLSGILCLGCTTDGEPADVSEETPNWLSSPAELDKTVKELREIAKSSGRYFASGETPPDYGDNYNGTGITFIDGNGKLKGSGGGVFVVTGKLTLDETFDFNGLILVTGADGVRRSGIGTGTLQGNLVVAPYQAGNLTAGFLPPKYDLTGGLISSIVYKANGLLFGSSRINATVVAIAEK